jgi:hypothetical protein
MSPLADRGPSRFVRFCAEADCQRNGATTEKMLQRGRRRHAQPKSREARVRARYLQPRSVYFKSSPKFSSQ